MPNQVQRAVIVCPITRLGSLMDLAPFINGAINRFGPRTVLGLSRQARMLYRNRLSEASEKQQITAFTLADSYPKRKPAILPQDINRLFCQGTNLVMPVGDDPETSKQAGRVAGSIRNRYIIGTNLFCEGLYSIEEFFHQEFTFGFLDLKVEADGEDVPCPLFLNGHLKLLQTAAGIDAQDIEAADDPERKPIIWTTDTDKQLAEDFFRKKGISPENTIALHLTANSHHVYRNMMSKNNFLRIARHFISKGFSVLLVAGSIFNTSLSLYDKNYGTHLDFLETLDSPACKMFFGDCLVEAEVIRLCRILLSGETGVAHLASAVGTPKVTIAANYFQDAHFLMTGPSDREFVVRKASFFDTKRFPKAGEVIEAMENILKNQ